MFEPDDATYSAEKPHAKRVGRELAMQYLFRCEMLKELPDAETFELFYQQTADTHALEPNRLSRKAREFAEKLYTTVAIHQEEIDETIRKQAKNWDLTRLSNVDRNIMRVAVAEMLYFDQVPPVVSIDEAVEIALDFSGDESCSFINGVLNGVKDTLKRPARDRKQAAE